MPSLPQLCARYHNEDVHTEHVAALAVHLFDATHRWLGLSGRERRLIEAAARLHDVGYSVDPAKHPARSAAIVRRVRLSGFSRAQRRVMAAAIPFHSGNWTDALQLPHRESALAAFVRVADGLDHGHMQDAAIMEVKRADQTIRVAVQSPHFSFNITRANQKADLWRALFPVNIHFVAAPVRDPQPLVRADMPVGEAARRLMSLQFKTITSNVDGAATGESPEPLHDIRVAIRRLRLLLRVFRKHLPKSSRKPIDAALQQLNRDLGPARDLDVWVEFLESPLIQPTMAHSRLWRTFLGHQRQRRSLRQVTVRRCLRGAHFAAVRRRLAWLLRVELPRLTRVEPTGNLAKLATKNLEKELRQALKLGRLRHSDDPDELHRLRIALRRTRYLGEFFGPRLGPATEKLTRRVHATERALGRIHDVDTGLERVRHEGPVPPRALVENLQARRREQLQKLDAAWARLRSRP